MPFNIASFSENIYIKSMPVILLSFDVEEFDLPIEFGINISKLSKWF
jgi:hypothetical protein